MPILIPPPVAGHWNLHVKEVETEQVELPWSCIENWPRWQEGRTFYSILMEPLDEEARSVVHADLIRQGFVLWGMQHLIIDVDPCRPFVVRTQAWPVPPVEAQS